MRTCIYSGTFDPVTNGHMDIICRGAALFDKLIIGVAKDNYKNVLFNDEERIDILKEVTADLPNVEVEAFSGLLMDYCREKDATAVIRGLRAVSDFEYEMQMASMNRKLADEVDTLFIMTNNKYSFISSSIAKDVAKHHGKISDVVPPEVEAALVEKFK